MGAPIFIMVIEKLPTVYFKTTKTRARRGFLELFCGLDEGGRTGIQYWTDLDFVGQVIVF